MSNRTFFLLAALTSLSVSAFAQQPASAPAQSPRLSASAIQAVVPGPLVAPAGQAATPPAPSDNRVTAPPLGAPATSAGQPTASAAASSLIVRAASPSAQPAVAAQSGAPATAPSAAATTPVPGAPVAASIPSNPFNGAALTPEQLQRELELSRAQTRALEDKLLQSLPPEQAKALQARRDQDAARAAKPEAPGKASARDDKTERAQGDSRKSAATEPAAQKPRKTAAKPKRRAQPVKEVFENDLAEADDPGRPTLVSIVAVGSRYSVIFEVDGRTFTALDGELTPFGRLTVWDESCIDLGESRLRLMGGRMR